MKDSVFAYIKKRYKVSPEYPWRTSPDSAVFRHADNRKWFALFMEVGGDKLGMDTDGLIPVINLKIDDMFFRDILIARHGIIPAYHMNKQQWITVFLDGSVKQEQVFDLIDGSFLATASAKKKHKARPAKAWIIPANPAYYDVLGAFRRKRTRFWPTRKKMAVGDTVYIYYAAPYSCLVARCLVTGHDESGATGLTLQEFYERGRYPLALLKEHSCRTVRFVTRLPQELKEFLDDCREKEKS